ncbi:MAG TPA: SusD/RagB family nutrient-binding outer membrane lipoprotein, partial [Cyclobacteriaceae bacterium]
MKKIFFLKLIFIVGATMLVSSCKDLFDEQDIKVNPNAVTDVDVSTLLSATLVGLGQEHEDTDTRIAYIWAGQLAGQSRQHLGFGQYAVSSGNFSWESLYPLAS